jgi:N utilization substance protein B
MSRTTARVAAMQMIFERVSGGQGGEETLQMVYEELRENGIPGSRKIEGREPDEEDREYISRAFDGVLNHQDEIDDLISKTSQGWPIERMSLVDLTILRLAVWEILFDPSIPGSVSISEAVALTECYSDPEDKGFVNGILGTILRSREAES